MEAERRRHERERLERLEKARVGWLLAQAKALREAQEIRAYVSAVPDRQATLNDPLSKAGFQELGGLGAQPGRWNRPDPLWQLQERSSGRLRQANGAL